MKIKQASTKEIIIYFSTGEAYFYETKLTGVVHFRNQYRLMGILPIAARGFLNRYYDEAISVDSLELNRQLDKLMKEDVSWK